jgi:hypothetical protein
MEDVERRSAALYARLLSEGATPLRRPARRRRAVGTRPFGTCQRCFARLASLCSSRCCRWHWPFSIGVLLATGRVYGPVPRRGPDGVGRADSRHAVAAAALRPLFRPRGSRPASGVLWPRCSDSASTTRRTRAKSIAARCRRFRGVSSRPRERSASPTCSAAAGAGSPGAPIGVGAHDE